MYLASANEARQMAAQQQMSAVGQIAGIGMQAMDKDVSLFKSKPSPTPPTPLPYGHDDVVNKNPLFGPQE